MPKASWSSFWIYRLLWQVLMVWDVILPSSQRYTDEDNVLIAAILKKKFTYFVPN